jgi:hypothetical protein
MKSYFTSPPHAADRLKNTVWQDLVKDKWIFTPDAPHLHNNLATNDLRFNTDTNSFELSDIKDRFYKPLEAMSFAISSSLLLYRLMCVFGKAPIVPPTEDIYKSLWAFPLSHRSSGEYFTFLDYKGGATVNSFYSQKEDLPELVAKDLLELLEFLISDQIAHPYDNVLAGTVA